ncbi:malto-oligosyltrehalose synthase [Negadavirga shengliensis]|uniref:Malto-oligosyltrehalose synthase n=1 Tax=Negadavirga shengliensis TaxID=1389218 RepID=A0ABV9T3X4_9BACT
MKIPSSTYRIQFSSAFNFKNLAAILDYLQAFNTDTVYASPVFQARQGSSHGYDIVNPHQINEELGGMYWLKEVREEMTQRGMMWLQDIVPNHMALDTNNPWLNDVWERGRQSEYYHFFDIDWGRGAHGKVLLPVLGEPLDEAVSQHKLKVDFGDKGFVLRYFDQQFMVSSETYAFILYRENGFSDDSWKLRFKNYPGVYLKWVQLKSAFIRYIHENNLLGEVEKSLKRINSSFDELKELIDIQYYIPAYWKETESRINYRRFFTINELIGLRMEDQNVFETYHKVIRELCAAGIFSGLRVDHIDGLFHPSQYLQELRKSVGEEMYILVEKILHLGETLPEKWAVQGTSGYDFMALLNHLFVSPDHRDVFKQGYQKFISRSVDCEKEAYEKKLYILNYRMKGELENLWSILNDLLTVNHIAWFEDQKVKQALTSFLAAFPVYRIYPDSFPLSSEQSHQLGVAYETALRYEPELKRELDFLQTLFKGQGNLHPSHMVYFVRRAQQLTGPLAAKGLEDTLFYNYNMLLSLNEVGDSPCGFGTEDSTFHKSMQERMRYLSHSLNATATHDTKRGEDARARLNVLSEMPSEWFQKVDEWHSLNQKIREDKDIPDKNEEYFIYQALLGSMPFDLNADAAFVERSRAYVQKSLREAKLHSSWSSPDVQYEQAVMDFVSAIVNHRGFRESFDPFCHRISFYGSILSLGQSLIKVTAPGIPDIYQGTELWDLSYVDPDNRRAVDYEQRQEYLTEMKAVEKDEGGYLLRLMKNYQDGKIKMFTLWRALRERAWQQALFTQGDYVPINMAERLKNKVLAFLRRSNDIWYLIVVLLPAGIVKRSLSYPLQNLELGKCFVDLPDGSVPTEWLNVFTGKEITTAGGLDLDDLLMAFPVALLKSSFNQTF